MPRFPIKYPGTNDRYMIWSTIVDAPIIYDATWEEVQQFWEDEYGRSSVIHLRKMELEDFGETIVGNRAGDGEYELTERELLKKYPHSEPPTT